MSIEQERPTSQDMPHSLRKRNALLFLCCAARSVNRAFWKKPSYAAGPTATQHRPLPAGEHTSKGARQLPPSQPRKRSGSTAHLKSSNGAPLAVFRTGWKHICFTWQNTLSFGSDRRIACSVLLRVYTRHLIAAGDVRKWITCVYLHLCTSQGTRQVNISWKQGTSINLQ